MADNTSTTEEVDQNSGGSQQPLPEPSQEPTADEQSNDTEASEKSQDSGQEDTSNEPDSSQTTQNDGSDDDEGLAKFAKSQGFDPDNLTEGEKKALKIARDNQKAFHEERQHKSDELRRTEQELHKPDENADELEEIKANYATLKAQQDVNEFYNANPEAREYDKDMAKLVVEEAKKNGVEAARYLASDKQRLLILAKASRGDLDAETAREAGRKQEREELRRKQEASADLGGAQDSNPKPTQKVTREWINTSYDPKNPEHRKMVDEALANGTIS